MKITNRQGLPQAVVRLAEEHEELGDGVYRVTELIKGPREVQLLRRHGNEVTKDVSQLVDPLLGTAMHAALAAMSDEECSEQRLWLEVEGRLLSGRYDFYDADSCRVVDYKTTTAYRAAGSGAKEWRDQLMVYGWMLDRMGKPVKGGSVIAFIKNYDRYAARRDPRYPAAAAVRLDYDFTKEDLEAAGEYIRRRMHALKASEDIPDALLPLCSPAERGNRGERYRVMKYGRPRALRWAATPGEAAVLMADLGGDYMEATPGEDRKCLYYCDAAPWCSHAARLRGGAGIAREKKTETPPQM